MLADFQQALADLTASPELCRRARAAPALVRERYDLTEREWQRVVAIVNHPGMACACIVYRANRLAPLALNLPRLCKALGSRLATIATAYWAAFPESNVHFYVEAHRFCRFLAQQRADDRISFGTEIAAVLADESAVVAAALAESHTEGR